MEPKEIAAMLENHCNVGIMLIKSEGEISDWGTKAIAWGYLLGLILDASDDLDRTHYVDESQYHAFDDALMRALGTAKTLKDLLEGYRK